MVGKITGDLCGQDPPVQVLEGCPLTRGYVYLCSSLDEEQGLLSTFSRNSCWKLSVSTTLSFPFLEPWTRGNLFMLGKKKEVASPLPKARLYLLGLRNGGEEVFHEEQLKVMLKLRISKKHLGAIPDLPIV